MSFQDHLRTCGDCQKRQGQKPTIRIKSAASRVKEQKLSSLAALITGASYGYVGEEKEAKTNIKAASSISYVERTRKLKELSRLIRGV